MDQAIKQIPQGPIKSQKPAYQVRVPLDRYSNLPRKQRETAILQEYPAVFIYGIGWTLRDGYPRELRAADYDDWVVETVSEDGRPMHGLNGDILVWNPVTKRRHELTSMGIRVTAETLRKQLELTGQLGFFDMPYHQAHLERRASLEYWRRYRSVAYFHAHT